MRVLVAREYSGRVRDAFISKGHDAISCDILPTDKPGPHYQGDVRDIIDEGFDLLIAHPPCTYLTNAGVFHLHRPDQSEGILKGQPRWQALRDAARFFRVLLESKIPKKAIENPIPHKYAVDLIGRKYDQIVQPYMFGHTERKATCFWLEGIPKLKETSNVKEEMMKLPKNKQQRMHYLPPSKDRWKLRSETYQGIADAMANQWG